MARSIQAVRWMGAFPKRTMRGQNQDIPTANEMIQPTLKITGGTAQAELWNHSWFLFFLNVVLIMPPPGKLVDVPAYPLMCCFPLWQSPWLRSHHLLTGSLMQPPTSTSTVVPLSPYDFRLPENRNHGLCHFSQGPHTPVPANVLTLSLVTSLLTDPSPATPASLLQSWFSLEILHCVFPLPGATSSSDFYVFNIPPNLGLNSNTTLSVKLAILKSILPYIVLDMN